MGSCSSNGGEGHPLAVELLDLSAFPQTES